MAPTRKEWTKGESHSARTHDREVAAKAYARAIKDAVRKIKELAGDLDDKGAETLLYTADVVALLEPRPAR